MKRLCLALALTGFAAQVLAAPPLLQLADPLPLLVLQDQHDKPFAIPADTRQIVLTADMGGNGKVTERLDRQPPGWLAQNRRVYLADIHRMPDMVARLFALPQLREKAYPIGLGRAEADLVMFPRKKDCATLVSLSDGRVGKVDFACSDEELAAALAP